MRTYEKVIKTIDAVLLPIHLQLVWVRSFINSNYYQLFSRQLVAYTFHWTIEKRWIIQFFPNKINLAYVESHMSFWSSVDFSVVMLSSSCDYACRLLNLKKKHQRKPLYFVLLYENYWKYECFPWVFCWMSPWIIQWRVFFFSSCSILNI